MVASISGNINFLRFIVMINAYKGVTTNHNAFDTVESSLVFNRPSWEAMFTGLHSQAIQNIHVMGQVEQEH